MQKRPRVAIAGAGIAGLSTAAALSRLGFEVSLFEAEPGARKEGGALGIAPNGLAVLEKLGLSDEIKRASRSIRNGIVSDERLNRLMSFPTGAFGVALHRSDLLAILRGAAKHATLKYDKRLTDCATDDKGVGLTFADGSTFEADYLLGCDGIHSVARAKVASETKVRFVGESYWAGVSNHCVQDWDFCEAWGPGLRFGMVGLDGGRTYWFASRKSAMRDTRAPIDRSEIEALYHRFSDKVRAILQATPLETIFLANSLDLDPPDGPWFDGRICLVGDAAHATTPNLAQGANQAMENALTLAKCLDKDPSTRAFGAFRRLRAEKVKMVVVESWRMGKVSVLGPPWTYLRNVFLRTTPSAVLKSRFARMNSLAYMDRI